MENDNSTNNETAPKMTKGQAFLEEWKRRKKEDEEWFKKQLNDPEYRKAMDKLAGKIVKNGKIVSASE